MTHFLPHAIVQLDTGFFCDLELMVGGVPHASCLIVQGKQVMAQGRDCWKGKEKKEEKDQFLRPTVGLD